MEVLLVRSMSTFKFFIFIYLSIYLSIYLFCTEQNVTVGNQANIALNATPAWLNCLDHSKTDLFFGHFLCDKLDQSTQSGIKAALDKDVEVVISFWLIRLSYRS